ncbi:hypothetical protein [Cyclobacterium plantarum]|uniref:hypothetical protein n=1 Tax=Cyclobacterium plantarum TaxID=2716263 RepID=UPI003F6F86ED
MKNNSLTYELRLIAFIDILGFKEIVKQSETDSSKIQLIFSVLEYLKGWEKTEKWNLKFVEIEESAQYKGLSNFDLRGKTNTTSFSDSIVVSVKVDKNVNEMASTLIVNLAYIGTVLLEKGILIRGGLTIGNIFHTDNGTVFGQGLIDAFLLETKSAKFPRIVLSDKLLNQLNYPLETKRSRYPYHQYLDRFEDGCVGFHQLIYYQVIESWTEMIPELLTKSLNKVRKVIISGLDSSFERPEVFEKYKWLKEQYNKLIILSDFSPVTKTEENIKQKIRERNVGIGDQNIHYSYTDDFYNNNSKDKK